MSATKYKFPFVVPQWGFLNGLEPIGTAELSFRQDFSFFIAPYYSEDV